VNTDFDEVCWQLGGRICVPLHSLNVYTRSPIMFARCFHTCMSRVFRATPLRHELHAVSTFKWLSGAAVCMLIWIRTANHVTSDTDSIVKLSISFIIRFKISVNLRWGTLWWLHRTWLLLWHPLRCLFALNQSVSPVFYCINCFLNRHHSEI